MGPSPTEEISELSSARRAWSGSEEVGLKCSKNSEVEIPSITWARAVREARAGGGPWLWRELVADRDARRSLVLVARAVAGRLVLGMGAVAGKVVLGAMEAVAGKVVLGAKGPRSRSGVGSAEMVGGGKERVAIRGAIATVGSGR